MKLFPDSKTFLAIGPFSIQWYAICIMTGAFLAYYLSLRNTRKRHYSDDVLNDYFVYALWIGVLGARLWYCLFYNLAYYIANPIKFLAINEGGLAIHGGVIAVLIYSYFYCHKKNIDILNFADCIMPNVLLAQAIGRWGNFINQEAHGPEVSESFFNGFLFFLKDGMYINGHYYEPTFFYESLANVIGFCLIVFVLKKYQNKKGDLGWAYLMWYGVVRFFIEIKRTDALFMGNLKIAQVISVSGLIIGLLGYLGVFDKFFKAIKPTVLFDLDGTLVDTEKAILESFEKVFEEKGKKEYFLKEVGTAVIGPSLTDSFKKYMPEEDSDKMIERYRYYNNEALKYVEAMPHAREVLTNLKEAGVYVGVVTVRHKKSANFIFENLKMQDLIIDIIAGDEVKNIKPNPEGLIKIIEKNNLNRDDVTYVGDSDTDIYCGKNYGAYTIGFYFNEQRKEKLDKANADDYISDLKDLIPILNKKYSLDIKEVA